MSKQKGRKNKGRKSSKVMKSVPEKLAAVKTIDETSGEVETLATGGMRGPGRPRVSDPRVSTHLQLTRDQRKLCGLAASHEGLSFAAWSRMVLLQKAREVLRTDLPDPSTVSIHT